MSRCCVAIDRNFIAGGARNGESGDGGRGAVRKQDGVGGAAVVTEVGKSVGAGDGVAGGAGATGEPDVVVGFTAAVKSSGCIGRVSNFNGGSSGRKDAGGAHREDGAGASQGDGRAVGG